MNSFSHISCKALNTELEKWTIVDIRDPQSYALAHVEGAMPLNNENIATFLENVEKDTPVAVMCYHGVSSQQAAEYLISQGLENVASVDGGFEHWRQHFPSVGGE